MPFLDSSTIRALYDVHDGGPPKGYECKLEKRQISKKGEPKLEVVPCCKVTRTLRGMIMHQKRTHGIDQQQELNFEDLEKRTAA